MDISIIQESQKSDIAFVDMKSFYASVRVC